MYPLCTPFSKVVQFKDSYLMSLLDGIHKVFRVIEIGTNFFITRNHKGKIILLCTNAYGLLFQDSTFHEILLDLRKTDEVQQRISKKIKVIFSKKDTVIANVSWDTDMPLFLRAYRRYESFSQKIKHVASSLKTDTTMCDGGMRFVEKQITQKIYCTICHIVETANDNGLCNGCMHTYSTLRRKYYALHSILNQHLPVDVIYLIFSIYGIIAVAMEEL